MMINFFKAKPQKPKSLGQMGEERAQEVYKKLGYKIIAKNEYNKKGKRVGEIDFIAKDKQSVVFVEVKTRTAGADKFGKGAESVNIYKQQKILRAVKMYFLRNPKMLEFKPQIDVCLMEYGEFDPVRSKAPQALAGAFSNRTSNGVDKTFKPAIIIPNAVEDWS